MPAEPTGADGAWGHYADLLHDGQLATFGFRVLVSVGADGEMHVENDSEGDVPAYVAIGAVLASTFERFHDHLHDHMEDTGG